MRLVKLLTFGSLCILLAGCASLKEKKAGLFGAGPKKAPSTFEAGPPAPDPVDPPPLASRNGGSHKGILAGRVIDSFNQQRPNTLIQVTAIDAKDNEPLEVSSNTEGYFMVQGLDPGKKYRLAARAKKGETVMGGTTIATPPNVLLVIKVSENLPAAEPTGKGGKKASSLPPAERTRPERPDRAGKEQSWAPDAAPKYLYEPDRGVKAAADDNPRARLNSPPTPDRRPAPQDPLPPVRPEYQTLGPGIAAINPPRAVLPPAEYGREAANGPTTATSGRGASCTVNGKQLVDFTLNDLNGQPFRFADQRGKLVLIDFWGTWCTACMTSLPYLVDLQRRYGGQGLEIIGIAYEEGAMGTERVNFVRIRQGINYKLLLGEGDSCPVLTKLNVREFPTLLLVDERGEIVWRAEGLTPQAKARLEAEVRSRLLAN